MGFMGSGKTTLGSALHQATGVEFVDLDDAIEQRAGTTIKQIFAERGEAAFRELETQTLAEMASHSGVIACGGGTPCFGNNMRLMNSLGTTVWLQAPIDLLVERLIDASAKRPLIAGMSRGELHDYVQQTVEKRTPYYSQAAHTFDASDLDTLEGIDRSVAKFVTLFFE